MTAALTGGHGAYDGVQVETRSEPDSASLAEGTKNRSARSRRRRRRLLLALGAVVVLFVAATLALFVFAPTDQPRHVNGILSLNGGDEPAREAKAISLAEKGFAPVILFSRGSVANDAPCPKVPGISVVCFFDSTNNTRGEARWAGRYADSHHWRSLMIVPGRAQATRAPPRGTVLLGTGGRRSRHRAAPGDPR